MVNWQRGVMRLMRITNHEGDRHRHRGLHREIPPDPLLRARAAGPTRRGRSDSVGPAVVPAPREGRGPSQPARLHLRRHRPRGRSLQPRLRPPWRPRRGRVRQHCGQRTWCRWRWVRNRRHRYGGRRARRSVGGPGPSRRENRSRPHPRPASTCPTTPPTSSSPVTSPRCRPSTPGVRPSPPRWP
jgi:hypothetical protein